MNHQIKDAPAQVKPSSLLMENEAAVISSSLLCKASKEFLDFFRLENIGIDCKPKCGNCSCGRCSIGNKVMSIREEREYEVIRNNLKYDPVGSESDPGPYFRSALPCLVDKNSLGNNKSVILGTLNATLRKILPGEECMMNSYRHY